MWGIPPIVEQVIRRTNRAAITRYPTVYARELKEALAAYVGVEVNQVVTGCGSDDVLDSAIRSFGEPGERLAHPEPSFQMVPTFARMNGLRPIAVPLTPSFDIDATRVLDANARIVYLCSPNNPTGTLFSRRSIEAVIDNTRGVVIVDEAYAEFAGVSVVDLISRCDRLLIVRTLSKAFSLAGLRIGYAVGSPSLVAEVEKSRGPYKISAIAEAAALAAVGEGRVWVEERVREAIANRARLIDSLRDLGLHPLTSSANFVLVPVRDAVRLNRSLRASGVAIRPFPQLLGIGDAIRISVGPWDLLSAALGILEDVLESEPV
ncbi:MAG: histidinol-phosphate transaminase [Gemmatimonadaceae bacterium]